MTAVALKPPPADARLANLLEQAARLPSPPTIVLALIASLGNDDAPVDTIAAHAGRDQALTARLLRIANSPWYGLSTRVASVRGAATVLGFANVRNLVIATEVINRYPAAPGQRAMLAGFWKHGLVTAFCAAALARRCGAEEGLAFTAGLLHDIGKLVQASADPAAYASLPAAEDDRAGLEVELFGANHAALGALIAERWRFPPPLCAALRSHHTPGIAEPLTQLVIQADRLAHALEAPQPDARLQQCADALAALGSRHTAPELLAELEKQSAVAAELAP